MTSKIDELNEELDKINCGLTPNLTDQEIAEMLEIAMLLRQADLPVQPPDHILSAAVQRAAEGLKTVDPAPNRRIFRYSGLLGAAAALLIFAGIHGFPSIQEVVPLVSAPSPSVTGPLPSEARSIGTSSSPESSVHPSSTPASSSPTSPAQEPLASSPAAKPVAASSALSSDVQPASSPKVLASEAPPQTAESMPQSRKASAVSTKAAVLPPPSPSATVTLRLPGRTPDSVVNDSAAGIIRQSFDTGTPRELILTQRSKFQTNSGKVPQSGQSDLREVDKGKMEAAPTFNRVVVVVAGQEVTLEGRQTIQELAELARTLTN